MSHVRQGDLTLRDDLRVEFFNVIVSQSFIRPDALKKHLTCYHENVKAFYCHICTRTFKGHLPQHMRTHENVKLHGCANCGATFSQKSQLIVHQRIHSGERPYRCQVGTHHHHHSSQLTRFLTHFISISGLLASIRPLERIEIAYPEAHWRKTL